MAFNPNDPLGLFGQLAGGLAGQVANIPPALNRGVNTAANGLLGAIQAPLPSVVPAATGPNPVGVAALQLAHQIGRSVAPNPAPNAVSAGQSVPQAIGQANTQLYTGLRGDQPPPDPDPLHHPAVPPQAPVPPPPPAPPGGQSMPGANANYVSPYANIGAASAMGASQMPPAAANPVAAPPVQPIPNAQPGAATFGSPPAVPGAAQIQPIPNVTPQPPQQPAPPAPAAAPPAPPAAPPGAPATSPTAAAAANQTYEAEIIAAMINGQQVQDSTGRVIADFSSLPTGARQAILYGLTASAPQAQAGFQNPSQPFQQQQAPPSFGSPQQQQFTAPPAAPVSSTPTQPFQGTPPSPAQPGAGAGFVAPTAQGLLPNPAVATGINNVPFTPSPGSAIQPAPAGFSPTGTAPSSAASSAAVTAQIQASLALTHPDLYQQTQGFQNFYAQPTGTPGQAYVPGYGVMPIQDLYSSKGSILQGPYLAAHLDSLVRKGTIPGMAGGGAAGQSPFQQSPFQQQQVPFQPQQVPSPFQPANPAG